MTDDNIDEESLRDLQALTAKLPRDIVPPGEAWGAIRMEIDRTRGASQVPRPGTNSRAVWQRPAFLVAAAVLLVAGSSAITGIAMGRRDSARDIKTVTARSTVRDATTLASAKPATLAEFAVVENDYISTANRLTALLEGEETQLAPETIAKLRESLRVIDAAILEARQALAADPANRQLIEMLSTSYNQKVDLLKRTTDMGQS